MDQYQFSGSLMLRTPFFSYQSYALSKVSSVLEDVQFKTALYLANPGLYQLLAAKQFNWSILTAKEKLTISRYYNRICFRPTPFGTFASFSLVKWGSSQQIKLDEGQIHLQLDQEVTYHLASALTTELLNQTFRLNPTLYKVGREYRFVKTIYQAGEPKFSFSLESFNADKLTNEVFGYAKNFTRTGTEIASFIENLSGCTLTEATAFFKFLASVQILKAIQNSELNQFIDTKNRVIILPEDVKQRLEKEQVAFKKYQKLAYSHQKEYSVWILTAKQEKTRTGRVFKMIEKLLEVK